MSLTDITGYFDQNSKKRDLRDNSNQEESSKKLKDGSLNTSRASDIPEEVFTESLKSPGCVNILFSCIKNVERQITQIFENTKELQEGQIKGEKYRAELTDPIDFISKKFKEYEKERKEKEERIKTLEECLTNMSKRVDSLSSQVDKHEQHSRRNFLLLHGIPENENEKTDDLCLANISENLELAITEVDIERTHRTGKPRDVGQKSKLIIVKFVKYNDRKNVFNRKKKLKGKNISITES